MKKGIKIRMIQAGVLLVLSVGLIYACFPFLWMLSASVKSNTEIFMLPPQLIPREFTLSPYLNIFSDPGKIQFFVNSYIVSFLATLLDKVQ